MNFQTRSSGSGKAVRLAIFLALTLGLSSTGHIVSAQNAPEQPRREQLLNGLRVLLWPQPADQNVTLMLRIHSGAAFDLAGKAGTMAILGDSLFPDPATREFITEELGGRLLVTTDYDAINITLSGRASEFERLVELLRTALVTPLTAETVGKLREARAKIVREEGVSPAVIADRAISARLFGDFPYGRPYAGSTDSLVHLERGDLLFARERFLNSDNATLVVMGGVESARAMRALRQLLGIWRKGDRVVPATFRQPDAPDARTLIIDLPGTETTEIRLATRGLSRADADYAAATLLALLARDRWQATLPELNRSAFFVRHEAHQLPGMFVLGAAVRTSAAASTLEAARNVIRTLATTPPSAAELERVKSEAVALFNRQTERPESLAGMWLDVETYKLAPLTEQARALSAVTPVDVQRTAARLFRETPVAAITVGSAAKLRPDLERMGKVEIVGEQAAPKPLPAASPSKSP